MAGSGGTHLPQLLLQLAAPPLHLRHLLLQLGDSAPPTAFSAMNWATTSSAAAIKSHDCHFIGHMSGTGTEVACMQSMRNATGLLIH